jgi:hypothetical protein
VRGGGFGAHPEVIISGINLNQHTRRNGWMDGWMDGGWRKEIRSTVSLKEFVM